MRLDEKTPAQITQKQMSQTLLGEILNNAESWCVGEMLLRPERCKIRRGASVNGWSRRIEFQEIVAPAINLAHIINTKYGLHAAALLGEWVFQHWMMSKRHKKLFLIPK